LATVEEVALKLKPGCGEAAVTVRGMEVLAERAPLVPLTGRE
jgi:hypothetical protein